MLHLRRQPTRGHRLCEDRAVRVSRELHDLGIAEPNPTVRDDPDMQRPVVGNLDLEVADADSGKNLIGKVAILGDVNTGLILRTEKQRPPPSFH